MYDQKLFNCTRGNLNCSASEYPGTLHFYVNPADTIYDIGPDNMTSANYFPAFFGFREGQVLVNDTIFMRGLDGSATAIVGQVYPTTSLFLLPNPVNEKIITKNNVNVSGPWASPIPVNLKFTINGTQVLMECLTSAEAVVTTSTFISFPAAILNEAGILPAIDGLQYSIEGANGGNNTGATVTLTAGGDINVTVREQPFALGADGGFYKFAISYSAQ